MQVEQWNASLEQIHRRIAWRFGRAEPRARSLGYLRGLLGNAQRKNGWQLAEELGEATPDGVQRLLNAADWDAEAVRDDLREYVLEHLYDRHGVLIVDETGFLKKGTKSAGVKRQYTGTAGKIENCQVGVFCCYASPKGAALIDRALYLPENWCDDPQRCHGAGIPDDIEFRSKPALARAMIERALDAGAKCAWVLGDEVYGNDRRLRFVLEQRGQPFVLAVAANTPHMFGGPDYLDASKIAALIPPEHWHRLSAGRGTKGPRHYDWAAAPLWRLQLTEANRRWVHGLLVRRSITDPAELAYYVVFARRGTTLQELVRAAGSRWAIEAAFESAKQECGLDDYEVRRWDAWHRHMTLAMLAHAFLAAMRAQAKKGAIARN